MSQPSWIGYDLAGRYHIESELGHGGMSDVFKATDANLPRVVAVKIIHPHLSRDPEFVRRFKAEATVLAQLRHPNIVQVIDLNHDDQAYFIVLEFVPGETLQARLKRLTETDRKMEIDDVLKIALNIGDALQYAHERDMVHRDVKPANVMLNVHSEAILMDFGIVKIVGGTQHTATGAVLGTARYMSPEQIKGQRVGVGSDIYSFGVMLYEMLGGRPPFNSDSAMTLMMMHINEPVPNIDTVRRGLPRGMAHIINKALSKEVGQRYGSMAEMLADLRRVQAGDAAVAPAAAPRTAPVAAPKQREVNLTELIESDMDHTESAGAHRAQPARMPAQQQPQRAARPRTQAVPPPPPGVIGAAKSNQRTYIIASVLAVAAVLVGIYLIFGTGGGGDDGEGQETQVAVVGDSTSEATPVAGGDPSDEATPVPVVDDTPEAEATATEAAPTATDEPLPTDTPAPTATVPPTATNPPPPTATNPPPPTATSPPAPTATSAPVTPYSVAITGITINNNQYAVSYETFGYTESLPGMHIHFFFDTVPPEQAGVPGSGPWILYGGPRPFTGYGVGDRPGGANYMCALVANPDHSVIANSGNCWGLP